MRVTGLGVCQPEMTYHTETIELKEYVRGVLPSEWLPSWDDEALKAGALAVKNFAVSRHNAKGYLWDCTFDAVHDPRKRTEQTDQAVDDTWDWWLVNETFLSYNGHYADSMGNQLLVRTYFNADSIGCATQGDNCMSQYGSQKYALEGFEWKEILLKYYEGVLVELPHDVPDMIRRYLLDQ